MRDGAVEVDVDREVDDGRILRTHVMRPTWHFVAAADIRWMVELTGPRVQQRMAAYEGASSWMRGRLVRGLGIIARALRDRQDPDENRNLAIG